MNELMGLSDSCHRGSILNLLTVPMVWYFVGIEANLLLQMFSGSLCVTQQHGNGEHFLILNKRQGISLIRLFWPLIHQVHRTSMSSSFRRSKFGTRKVEMFSSRYYEWLEYCYLFNSRILISTRSHALLGRFLHVQTTQHVVLEELVESGPPLQWTIKLPLYDVHYSLHDYEIGCLGQSFGVLHYAVPDKDGHTIVIWSHEARDGHDLDNWTVSHRLSMKDAFGRDEFVHYDKFSTFRFYDYGIVAMHMERDVLFLRYYKAKRSSFLTTSALEGLLRFKILKMFNMAIVITCTMWRAIRSFQTVNLTCDSASVIVISTNSRV